jgi:hypothetical protein
MSLTSRHLTDAAGRIRALSQILHGELHPQLGPWETCPDGGCKGDRRAMDRLVDAAVAAHVAEVMAVADVITTAESDARAAGVV